MSEFRSVPTFNKYDDHMISTYVGTLHFLSHHGPATDVKFGYSASISTDGGFMFASRNISHVYVSATV